MEQSPFDKNRVISVFDCAVLLLNLHRGAAEPNIGFEDASRTLTDMHLEMNQKLKLRKDLIESALWSCNLLDEHGKFFHPKGYTFDEFTRKLLPGDVFNKRLNLIEKH